MSDDERPIGDLARLARTIEVADRERPDPPVGLWDRIAEEAGVEATSTVAPAPARAVPLARRRGRLVTVAGIVGLAASVTLAAWLVARPGDDARVLAAASLSNDGLAEFPVAPHGAARLVDDHGRLFLELDLADAPSATGQYLEVWMIDRDVKGMVSLGPFHGNGRYAVPQGIDTAVYPVVDLSLEPADGQPTHSGVSIVRGVLGDSGS